MPFSRGSLFTSVGIAVAAGATWYLWRRNDCCGNTAGSGESEGLRWAGWPIRWQTGECKPKVAALNPAEFRTFTVLANEAVSHNTRRIRLALPEGTDTFGLPVASCLVTRIRDSVDSSKWIFRPYTPVTTEKDSQRHGHVDFVIKGYPEGTVSKYMTTLKPGESVELKGPITKINLSLEGNMLDHKREVTMLAGGTGITPMLQILGEVLREPAVAPLPTRYKDTQFTLLFANKSPEDILCKDYLDALAKDFPDRFKLHYVVDAAESSYLQAHDNVSVGRITRDSVAQYLPAVKRGLDGEAAILVCGPDSLLAALAGPKNPDKSQGPLAGVLKDLGYPQSCVFKF